jgi:hypothetical protein
MKRLFGGERGLATVLIVVLVALGVVVVGVVGTAAVLLSDDVAITVHNRSCGTLDIAQGSAALNINLPSQIAQGDTAIVQFPRRFVNSVTVTTGSIGVDAFGQTFAFGTARLDMQRSTWDGAPLAGLAGRQIAISGAHTLVLECR